MKVKTDKAHLYFATYITNGKEYNATSVSHGGRYANIIDDDGEELPIRIIGCPHLNGEAWEVIEDEE